MWILGVSVDFLDVWLAAWCRQRSCVVLRLFPRLACEDCVAVSVIVVLLIKCWTVWWRWLMVVGEEVDLPGGGCERGDLHWK